MPKEKQRVEFRYYEIPQGEYILPLLGKGWEQEYGSDYNGILHFHNHLEIGYCYYGDGTLELPDCSVHYGEEIFTIIPKNIPHTTVSRPGHVCKWEYLFIDADRFLNDIVHSGQLEISVLLRIINRRGLILKKDEQPELAALTRMLLDLCREKPHYYLESIKGYLYALLIGILRLSENEEEPAARISLRGRPFGEISAYIRDAVRFMENNCQEEIMIRDVARACGLSESHFRKVFEQTMHMTPTDYLNLLRVDHACRLIESEELTIRDIAYRAGFTSLSTFNRNFRRITGLAPNEWKKTKMKNGAILSRFQIRAIQGWEAQETEKNSQTDEK